jgi:AP-2 complex subunit beta-1
MGNDMSPLFPDIINVMNVPILEIKKMVYLYLINYARSKPDMAMMAIAMFIKVNISTTQLLVSPSNEFIVY